MQRRRQKRTVVEFVRDNVVVVANRLILLATVVTFGASGYRAGEQMTAGNLPLAIFWGAIGAGAVYAFVKAFRPAEVKQFFGRDPIVLQSAPAPVAGPRHRKELTGTSAV